MNCLSEFGVRQSIVHQDIRAQAKHPHYLTRQPRSSLRGQAIRRSPLPASKAYQRHQARSKQRKLVRCQSSQPTGPGQWGQAVQTFILCHICCLKVLQGQQNPFHYRLTTMWSWWQILAEPTADLSCGGLICRLATMKSFSAR